MSETEINACPPHHWIITPTVIAGEKLLHHECNKCHISKDEPHPEIIRRWARRTTATTPGGAEPAIAEAEVEAEPDGEAVVEDVPEPVAPEGE